jgi:hypothetical protein
MSDEPRAGDATRVLATKLEDDFISPLTAIRGALEILRDYPDLDAAEREKFVSSALAECARIARGIDDLGASVYAGERRDAGEAVAAAGQEDERIILRPDTEILELDFHGIDFDSARSVDEMFDRVEARIADSGRRWWVLVNYTDCHVFPEAWIAFANRGKKIRVQHGYGTIRYDAKRAGGLPDRDGALAEIEAARQAMRR